MSGFSRPFSDVWFWMFAAEAILLTAWFRSLSREIRKLESDYKELSERSSVEPVKVDTQVPEPPPIIFGDHYFAECDVDGDWQIYPYSFALGVMHGKPFYLRRDSDVTALMNRLDAMATKKDNPTA